MIRSEIIDGQIHVWRENSRAHPWPAGAVSLHGAAFSGLDAVQLVEAEGIGGAILVPPTWPGYDNSEALETASRFPDRIAVMGRFDLAAPDAAQRLASWREQSGMLGIRVVLRGEDWYEAATGRRFDWFWSGCENNGVPLMCFAAGLIEALYSVADRFPGLTIIIDHAGLDPRGPKDEAAWAVLGQMTAAARRPNVYVKVSSLPSFSTEAFPFRSLHAPIRRLYDAFGSERMIWGSDVTRLSSSYSENINLFTEELPFFDDSELSQIMGGTLLRACRWNRAGVGGRPPPNPSYVHCM